MASQVMCANPLPLVRQGSLTSVPGADTALQLSIPYPKERQGPQAGAKVSSQGLCTYLDRQDQKPILILCLWDEIPRARLFMSVPLTPPLLLVWCNYSQLADVQSISHKIVNHLPIVMHYSFKELGWWFSSLCTHPSSFLHLSIWVLTLVFPNLWLYLRRAIENLVRAWIHSMACSEIPDLALWHVEETQLT